MRKEAVPYGEHFVHSPYTLGWHITTGLSSVELRIPATTAAKIVAEALLGSLEANSDFKRQDRAFWADAALVGATPLLTINATVTLGALRLVMT
jgi:hypothetical protein